MCMQDDFIDLLADMFGVRDEHRDSDESYIEDILYEKFDMDLEQAYNFANALLEHTPKVEAGFSGKTYHAFVAKSGPVLLMKKEAL